MDETLYGHLSKYNKAGPKVKQGDIGYVGSTGDLKASFTL
jgi:murein DD-endopeptidase MepM/ murein hydrolase activator NlpD